jgi:hypothetical protein
MDESAAVAVVRPRGRPAGELALVRRFDFVSKLQARPAALCSAWALV